MTRYLFVTNSSSGGGAERATNILVNQLQALGVEAGLLAINDGPVDLVQPIQSVIFLKRKWRGGIFETLHAGISFRKAITRLKPDVLISNCDLPEFMVAFFAPKCRVICVEHSRKPWINRKLLGRFTRMILALRKAEWVVVSSFLKPWGLINPRVTQLNNPIDLQVLGLPASHHSRQGANGIRNLVFVGRLNSEQKRPDWAVRIAKSVELPIIFIGAEIEKQKLDPLIAELNVKATFKGQVLNPWSNWESGDLLIVPSSHEADGLVALEALALNIPILLSDIPEFRRFGLKDYFYCTDEVNFSTIIEKNKFDINIFRVGLDSRRRILEERDPLSIAKKWEIILKNHPS